MNIEIANRLVQLRREHGYSQEELAEKLGLSRQAVSKWERAEASPDTDNLILLARLYDISLDQLLYTEDEIPRPEPGQSAAERPEETEPPQKKRVSVGLNGIHVHDGDEEVYIGLSGIHVRDGIEEVHVGLDGIHVTDGEEQVHVHGTQVTVNGREYDRKELFWKIWRDFPIVLLTVSGYLLLGILTGAWHPGWLLFFAIPLYSGSITAAQRHSLYAFPYPVLALLGMFLLGIFVNGWAWSWLTLLTIPLYYTLIAAIQKRKPQIFAYPVLALLIFFLLGFFADLWHPGWVVILTIPLYYSIIRLFCREK